MVARRHQHRPRQRDCRVEIESAGGSPPSPSATDVSDEQQVQAMIASAVDQLRPARHPVQQRRNPHAAAGHDRSRTTHSRTSTGWSRSTSAGCSSGASMRCCGSRSRGTAASSSTPARWPAWWGGAERYTAPPRAGCIQLTRAVAVEARAVRHPGQRDLPGGDAADRIHGGGRAQVDEAKQAEIAEMVGATTPARPCRSPPRTAPRRRCTWCRTRRATSPGWRCRSTVGTSRNDDPDARP